MAETIVLAYSGGLDTSVATKWLQEEYGYDVICVTIDLGNLPDVDAARERAFAAGAKGLEVIDGREDFLRFFAFPALAANAVYEGQYPLATALGRPLIAKMLVDQAHAVGATAIAHGCTGKGNDQVRFDVAINALAPDMKIVGTARENLMTRDEAIAYAAKFEIPVTTTLASPYSTDENMWGRSVECGDLEDPWLEPPEDVFTWTNPLDKTPDQPVEIEISFDQGVPVALDGDALDPVSLVDRVSELSGEHGIGRIDMVENRLVGIKSREIYEAPAAVTLLEAHRALEAMTLSKHQLRMKERVAQEYADLIYNGLWFTAHHQDLAAYVQSSQRHVTGDVRMRLWRGTATAMGRRSERSLYSHALATYGEGDEFDQAAAQGFIKLWGLPVQVQAGIQLLNEPGGLERLAAPDDE
ncbi:MAG TPA: argininosuccinate synthase [Dehalococcoidia bacterium]|nr:argininosuccinate synthase [Dehalococcoidia bacterium]